MLWGSHLMLFGSLHFLRLTFDLACFVTRGITSSFYYFLIIFCATLEGNLGNGHICTYQHPPKECPVGAVDTSGERVVRLEHSCTSVQASSSTQFFSPGSWRKFCPYLWGNRLRSNLTRGSVPARFRKCLFLWYGYWAGVVTQLCVQKFRRKHVNITISSTKH